MPEYCDVMTLLNRQLHKEVPPMSKSASMYIRIDPTVKAEVEAIYSHYGIAAFQAFICRLSRELIPADYPCIAIFSLILYNQGSSN